jgi:hypothetical protein
VGHQVSDRLNRALDDLINEGEISSVTAKQIRQRYDLGRSAAADESGSRRSILAEIGGYLGGTFTAIAAGIILNSQWDRLTKTGQVSIFAITALLLAFLAVKLNYLKNAQRRVAGLLFPASALATTAAFGTLFGNDGPYSIAFLIGTIVALLGYLRVQTPVGQISLYIGIFATTIAANEQLFNSSADFPLLISWLLLASIWLWLTLRLTLQEDYWGYSLVMGTYFISAQYLQINDHHGFSYLVSALTAAVGIWFYLQTRKWPLLIGALAIATLGVGTFIVDTFNGALGAALALLVGGLILIGGSLWAFRREG